MDICTDLEDENSNKSTTKSSPSKRKTLSNTKKYTNPPRLSKKQQVARERERDDRGQFVRQDGTNKNKDKQKNKDKSKATRRQSKTKKNRTNSNGMFAFRFNSIVSFVFSCVCLYLWWQL